MAALFKPLKIKSIELKNRIVISPMCEYSSVDGFANDWHFVHLGSRAVGGAGLIITEATAVSPEGRITPDDLGIWKDEHLTELKKIVGFIHQNGSVAGVQLAHAGRKASHQAPWKGGMLIPSNEPEGWQTVAPSAIPYKEGTEAPMALDEAGIAKVIADFKEATRRSVEVGFKVIELHAAHGYLLHQFLSPLTNQRTDQYGGSFENRIRFLLEVTAAVQEVWPKDLPLFVRISATDWAEGGWSLEESVKLSEILKNQGVDLMDCSSGGLVSWQKIAAGPNYQVPFAKQIKKETGILTGAVGLLTEAKQMEEIINSGQADLVLIARESLRDPYFPLHAAQELGVDLQWPVQYERAKHQHK
ncbi:NADPH dehydrogenase NamA [uncultured Mucilaginibacter sp.]|uniref:NADPH dehydrogenase NamA n=1 Tax=uncultured Mucilaginibacter sp. TaxID=797541 RepID=UPI0026313A75|nr:NADPH dehydrogenase NamA [uncultured Mucilaginibacter sp.]